MKVLTRFASKLCPFTKQTVCEAVKKKKKKVRKMILSIRKSATTKEHRWRSFEINEPLCGLPVIFFKTLDWLAPYLARDKACVRSSLPIDVIFFFFELRNQLIKGERNDHRRRSSTIPHSR